MFFEHSSGASASKSAEKADETSGGNYEKNDYKAEHSHLKQGIWEESYIFSFLFFFSEKDWPWANTSCQSSSFLLAFSPKPQLYILVVSPSCSSVWDAAPAQPDEWCVDLRPRIRTAESPATNAECANLTT